MLSITSLFIMQYDQKDAISPHIFHNFLFPIHEKNYPTLWHTMRRIMGMKTRRNSVGPQPSLIHDFCKLWCNQRGSKIRSAIPVQLLFVAVEKCETVPFTASKSDFSPIHASHTFKIDLMLYFRKFGGGHSSMTQTV